MDNDKKIIITFPNETSVLRCEKALMENGIKSKIISIPSWISAGCGLALKIDKDLKEKSEAIIKDKNIKCDGFFEEK